MAAVRRQLNGRCCPGKVSQRLVIGRLILESGLGGGLVTAGLRSFLKSRIWELSEAVCCGSPP